MPRVDYARAPDEALVARLRDGDAEALRALYERYGRITFALATRILRDPTAAEEVVQEVFLKLWRRPESFVPTRGQFPAWLMSVAHHAAVDELRHRRHEIVGLDRTIGDDGEEAADEVDLVELAWVSEQRAALRSLPDAQRRALELAYFGGLTQREVAATLGEAVGTIKTRIRLGMRKLRLQLTGVADGAPDDEADASDATPPGPSGDGVRTPRQARRGR